MFKPVMLSTFSDLIGTILENQAFLIAVITMAATILLRAGIKIYNMGRLSKADLITRDEFVKFEARMRNDMKLYRDEIFNSIWELCKTYMSSELKDVSSIKSTAEEMKILAATYEAKMENAMNTLNDIRPVINDVHRLERKLNRLEFGETVSKNDRRTDEE